ncbi:MAG: branched-chain amino acid ABC transporter permease [Oscillospiraceae bacterium]|jgi:branched-chain amino acid transport system permease protein|nr:branched-chain amino acid ABC transporter permease [Oscillospiraceae bacterium]
MKKLSKKTRSGFINYGLILVFFLVFQILISTGSITNSLKGQLIPICAYMVMAVSLNIVVGFSGELSLGHAGFMSVGAFTGVIVSTSLMNAVPNTGLRLLLAMVIGALFAAIAGVIVGIPVLRLRGDYLAIVTLAFGEIIKNILNCLYVGYDKAGLHISTKDIASIGMDETGVTIVNGPMGAIGITKISTFLAGVILILIVLFVTQNMMNSRTGRAIMGIRDNRIAAEACGLNVTKYKLIAFVISAAMAGAAGALYALNYSTIVPKKFDFNTSILVLVFVVLGGMGNIRGSLIAAAVLTVLPELLRKFSDYRMLIYAIVLIVIMIATNNEKARAIWNRVFAGLGAKPRKKEADGNG